MRNGLFIAKQDLGRVETRKGKLAEQRVLEAINTFAVTNVVSEPWFKSARLATWEEDTKGIDLLIETLDIGVLYLQVKSSWKSARRYREKYPRMVIAVVVIPFHEKLEIIWQKVLLEIIKLRREIIRRRNGN